MRILVHRIVVLLGIMLMLAGCGTSPRPSPRGEGEACRTLVFVDSLMWQQPDSAFALLQTFAATPEADSLDEFEGHYFQLLLSELLYKNDYQQTNRKDLLRAVAYFDSLTLGLNNNRHPRIPHRGLDPRSPNRNDELVFLTARTHYINGVGYYERDSVMEACAAYLKTLEIMEGNFEEKDLRGHKAQFMTYTFNRLGDLFSEQLMMEPSIECYDNALVFCKIKPTSPQGIANILSRIGLQYDKLGDKEKMRYYYERALKEMPAVENSNYRDLKAIVALCDYQLGSGIEKPMKTLMEVLDRAEDDGELMSRYLTIGDIYYEEGLYDSALHYLKPIFEKQKNVALKVHVAGILHDIYSDQGDSLNADKYAHYIVSQKKSEGENMVLVSKLEGLFQTYSINKQKERAEKERLTVLKKAVGVIIPIAALVLLFTLSMARLKGKKRLRRQQTEADRAMEEKERLHRQELKQRQADAEQRLDEVRMHYRNNLEELRMGLQSRDNQIDTLKAAMNQRQSNPKSQYEAFLNEPVCRKIIDTVSDTKLTTRSRYGDHGKLCMDEAMGVELGEAVSRHFPNFKPGLLARMPKMSTKELQMCYLNLLHLEDIKIAFLQQCHNSTVFRRKDKLQKAIGVDGDLSDFLFKLANGLD